MPITHSRLRPDFTFKTFVVGESNRFAFAVACAVAEKPGRRFNPLLLLGAAGLGKSHLLHAIGHELRQRGGGERILLVSAGALVEEIAGARRRGAPGVAELREKLGDYGALLIDDAHVLKAHRKAVAELAKVIAVLHRRKAQVVIAARATEGMNLRGLEEPLCMQFEWGMRVQIDRARVRGSRPIISF